MARKSAPKKTTRKQKPKAEPSMICLTIAGHYTGDRFEGRVCTVGFGRLMGTFEEVIKELGKSGGLKRVDVHEEVSE